MGTCFADRAKLQREDDEYGIFVKRTSKKDVLDRIKREKFNFTIDKLFQMFDHDGDGVLRVE